jgi:hypothetical protein
LTLRKRIESLGLIATGDILTHHIAKTIASIHDRSILRKALKKHPALRLTGAANGNDFHDLFVEA